MAQTNLSTSTPPQISHLVALGLILLIMMAYMAMSFQNEHAHKSEVGTEFLQSDNSPEISY